MRGGGGRKSAVWAPPELGVRGVGARRKRREFLRLGFPVHTRSSCGLGGGRRVRGFWDLFQETEKQKPVSEGLEATKRGGDDVFPHHGTAVAGLLL